MNIKITKYYTDWCGPCKMIERELEKLETQGVEIERINAEEKPHPEVMGVPVLFIEAGGKTERLDGYKTFNQIVEVIRSM